MVQHVTLLYPDHDIESIVDEILDAIGTPFEEEEESEESVESLNEVDCLLISYGDSIVGGNRTPIQNLKYFLDNHCRQQIPCVHVLPFYPFSSDDGFSVIDYLSVRADLGDWSDIEELATDYTLMVDLVINHISSQSRWFQEYCHGLRPNYFIEASIDDDLSQVVRPRVSPLLRQTDT